MFKAFAESSAGRMVFAVVALVCLLVIMGTMLKRNKKFTVKMMVYVAVCLALSTALSYITIYKAPYGGAVTPASMLFVMIPAYMFGPAIGLLAGVTHGLLQLVIDPQVYHPVQLLLDYPIAFGLLGLSGVFAKSQFGLLIGTIVGCIGRWAASTISGVVFFSEYAKDWNMGPWQYSIAYNGSYIGIELVIILIVVSVPVFKNAVDAVRKQATA